MSAGRGAILALTIIALLLSSQVAAAEGPTLNIWTPISLGQGIIGQQLAKMIEEFKNESSCNVEVTTPGYNEYKEKFVQAAIGGVAPDVVWTTEGGNWGDNEGLLLPLDDYIERSDKADWDDFFGAPKYYAVGLLDDRIYAMPLETDARVLAWNKRLFEEAGLPGDNPPEYWDELLAYVKKLTRFDGEGSITRLGFEFSGQGQWFATWLGLAGGSMWDESVIPPIAIPDLEVMVRGLEFVSDVIEAQGGWQAYSAYTSQGNMHSRFTSSTAMYVAGSWEIPNLQRVYPDLNFGIAHIPMERQNGQHYTLAGGWQMAIPAGADEVELAWKFIEWMTSTERIAEWAAANGYVPPRYSATAIADFQQWPENVIVEVAMHGHPWPRGYPGTAYMWQDAFNDVIQGKLPPQTAALKAKQAMQAAADEYFSEEE